MSKESEKYIELLELCKSQNMEDIHGSLFFEYKDGAVGANDFNDLLQNYRQANNFGDVTLREEYLEGIPAYHIKPEKPSQKVILYFHGGWFVNNLQHLSSLYRYFTCALAHEVHAEVYAIDYSVAPENPYPAALQDAYKAYLALQARGVDPKDIYFVGDASGGNLCLSLILKLKDEESVLPRACVLISPWADLACTGESYRTRKDIDLFSSPEKVKSFAEMYLQGHDPKDPYASPLYGNYKGLPPTMVVGGGMEILYDDAVRIAEKAERAGVDITLDIQEAMMHVYPILGWVFKEGQEATKRISKFIHKYSGEKY